MLLEKLRYLSRGADFVVFAGSLPRGVDDDFYADAIRELEPAAACRRVLDAEGEPLRLGLEAEPFLVSPNQREAEALVGQEFHDEEDFLMALEHDRRARRAQRADHATRRGCFALLPRGARRRAATARSRPQVEPVSAVGAGDVLLAGFIAARLDGRAARGRAARGGRRRGRVDARARRRPLRPARGRRRLPTSRDELERRRDLEAVAVRPLSLSSLEGLELGRVEVERLLALEREVRAGGARRSTTSCSSRPSRHVLPNDVSTATRLTRDDRARDPGRLGGDGHGHRGAARDRARARGGIGDRPPQPLDRGPGRRGRQGQALRGRDDRRAGDAAAADASSPRRSS